MRRISGSETMTALKADIYPALNTYPLDRNSKTKSLAAISVTDRQSGTIFALSGCGVISHVMYSYLNEENKMNWTKPAYKDLRIGFEVTMYFANR